MKKILGLDLGSASIGWAVIQEDKTEQATILGMGSRIIHYDGNEGSDFKKGVGESKNSLRTKARTARKMQDRYQLRRKLLVETLLKHDMYPTEQVKALQKMQLWKLRNDAPSSQISLPELGRILLLLNQKRGYKSSRSDANLDKKDTAYVEQVKNRHNTITEQGVTIGQFFYKQLCDEAGFNDQNVTKYVRIKDQIFPREAYMEEYDAIMQCQKNYHQTLTDELIAEIRNKIIYYQRKLKSQKGLVSFCEFEAKDHNGKYGGPRVAPKSSPIFQLAKIWENINNIRIVDKQISDEQRLLMFNYLNTNEKITAAKIREFLKLPKDARLNGQLKNGLTGNKTYSQIASCFADKRSKYESLFRFELNIIEDNSLVYLVDCKSGEIKGEKTVKFISDKIENEPYYMLWHVVYSIKDKQECKEALMKKFEIEEAIAEKLASLDLSISGFANKSAKVIRKILPYLMEGDMYSEAMEYAGYNHSTASITSEENMSRILLEKLNHLPKSSLRQPIVEKILNQMINVVNAVMVQYGRPDEIRIELSRELKQSKDERSETDEYMRKRERQNAAIKTSLAKYGLKDTRNNIIKWRLYEEIEDTDKKLNARCIYCGQPISLTQAILGNEVDIEHIIPKSKLFDDSQTNKTLAHRSCNSGKGDQTAYDYMKSKSTEELEDYVQRVEGLYKSHLISSVKYRKLLMTEAQIPDDFIDRQLRESQYIARKSREILLSVSRNVWCTGGVITAHLRKLWGWDGVTMNLQLPKYKEVGMTEFVSWDSDHGKNQHSKEVIKGWDKREDHRHHAIDALVIACTKQGYIQRINTLASSKTRNEMYQDVSDSKVVLNEKHTLLNRFLINERPFTTDMVEDAVARILISFKSGKKSVSIGTRKVKVNGRKVIVQSGILIPRGPLSEDSVYGKIRLAKDERKPIKYLFENPHLIFKAHIKSLVEERLSKFDADTKKAIASLKKEPIYLDEKQEVVLEWARCYSEEYIIKYKVNIDFNKVDKVVDKGVREILEARLSKFSGKSKEAFKDVKNEDGEVLTWWQDEGLVTPILSVRCLTGLSAVVPVKMNESGEGIGFVKPGNNHHVAFYRDSNGVQRELVSTFWHVVERQKFGLPAIIKNPIEALEMIEGRNDITEQFIRDLPDPTWVFEIAMQINDMFVLGMTDEALLEATATNDYATISKCLYRVQKLSKSKYYFRHHLETKTDDKYSGEKSEATSKECGKLYIIQSFGAWNALNPHKVKTTILGEIVKHD